MGFKVTWWKITGAVQEEGILSGLPTCVGEFPKESDCATRPAHVVSWTENRTGMPGAGKDRVYAACHYHLHRLVKNGERFSASGYVAVSSYGGR